MRTAWPQVLTLAFIVGAAGAACDDPPAPDPAPTPPGDVVTAADGTRFAVEVVAQNLEIPWALAFAPDGRMFVTERPGRVRIFQSGQVLAAPALVLTDVAPPAKAGSSASPCIPTSRPTTSCTSPTRRGSPAARGRRGWCATARSATRSASRR